MTSEEFIKQLQFLKANFRIDFVYISLKDKKFERLYINPSDDKGDILNLLNSKIHEYDSTIKNYLSNDNDLGETHAILLREKTELEKILSLNNVTEVLNYYQPLLVDDSIGIQPDARYFKPNEEESKYLFDHFVFRKDYIKELLNLVENYLFKIKKFKGSPVKTKLANKEKLKKIVSEFTYLIEQGILCMEDLDQVQISAIRFKLFEIYGLADSDFSKERYDIISRKPDNRFRNLSQLIADVSNKIEKIPYRKKTKKSK